MEECPCRPLAIGGTSDLRSECAGRERHFYVGRYTAIRHEVDLMGVDSFD